MLHNSPLPSPPFILHILPSRHSQHLLVSHAPPLMSSHTHHLHRSGLGALEMFCMGLKATGTYVSRTLAYSGAEFRMETLDIDPIFK